MVEECSGWVNEGYNQLALASLLVNIAYIAGRLLYVDSVDYFQQNNI